MPRKLLLVISFIDALSALACGLLFLMRPDGSLMFAQVLLPALQKFPLAHIFFQDFLWTGIAMLLVLFLPNAVAFVMTRRRSQVQYVLQAIAGGFLLLWVVFELIFMPSVLGVFYLAVGAAQVVLAVYQMRSAASGAEDHQQVDASAR